MSCNHFRIISGGSKQSGELHYLPLEERELLSGEWDNIPGVFLPTTILDLCFTVIPSPPEDIINQIALLSWITPLEVKQYKAKINTQIETQMKMDREKDRWKLHPLYKQNSKDHAARSDVQEGSGASNCCPG